MSDALFNKIFEFNQTANRMEKQANKSKQLQDLYTKKIKEAIQKKNPSLAKEYGEKAYECGRKYHNRITMQAMLIKDLNHAISKKNNLN